MVSLHEVRISEKDTAQRVKLEKFRKTGRMYRAWILIPSKLLDGQVIRTRESSGVRAIPVPIGGARLVAYTCLIDLYSSG